MASLAAKNLMRSRVGGASSRVSVRSRARCVVVQVRLGNRCRLHFNCGRWQAPDCVGACACTLAAPGSAPCNRRCTRCAPADAGQAQ